MKTNMEDTLETFRLDDRLARDSVLVTRLGLCELRLQNDSRWPWLVLVPQRDDVSELFDLTPLDQAMLTFETNLVAAALKEITGLPRSMSARWAISSGSFTSTLSPATKATPAGLALSGVTVRQCLMRPAKGKI